jgi:lysozyme
MAKPKTRVVTVVVLAVSTALVVLLFLLVLAIRNKVIYINDWFVAESDVRGVDVSGHQVDVDMKKLAEQNVQFIYIKATEGSSFVDNYFETNWKNAADAGIPAGAYHYFSFMVDGESQAENYITSVGESLDGRLIPAVDLELGENTASPNKTELVAELKTFNHIIEEQYGVKPLIYAQKDFYDKYLRDDFADYPRWIRSVYYPAAWENGDDWLVWQYKDRGELQGYSGGEKYIDLNVLNRKHNLDELKVKATEAK